MSGRFVIRRDHESGTFMYMARDYSNRSALLLLKKSRFRKRTIAPPPPPANDRVRWVPVSSPEDATRFWNKEAAEAAIFLLAVEDMKWGWTYSVREWDGSQWKRP